MKKFIKSTVFVFAMMLIGIVTVSAATSNIATFSNYTISSGGEFSVSDLTPSMGYTYAIATMTPTSATSGTKKTVYVGYLKNLTYYNQQVSKTTAFSTTACTKVSIGKIGSGTWKLSNQAYDGTTTYAGWSGELIYSASTSA